MEILAHLRCFRTIAERNIKLFELWNLASDERKKELSSRVQCPPDISTFFGISDYASAWGEINVVDEGSLRKANHVMTEKCQLALNELENLSQAELASISEMYHESMKQGEVKFALGMIEVDKDLILNGKPEDLSLSDGCAYTLLSVLAIFFLLVFAALIWFIYWLFS